MTSITQGALDFAGRSARRRPEAQGRRVVSKLDRLPRDVHFISGLMAIPFIAELGSDVDPFVPYLDYML